MSTDLVFKRRIQALVYYIGAAIEEQKAQTINSVAAATTAAQYSDL